MSIIMRNLDDFSPIKKSGGDYRSENHTSKRDEHI